MKNNLLKISKTTQKHKKQIKITIREKEAINTWYKKYKTNDLTDEVSNYPNFQKYILEKLLGYKHETDFKFEYSLSGKHVEFMILKNGEPYIPIELKGTNTNLDKSSHGLSAVEQASNYASKKSSIEWYIVSNYHEFRLYNKKSQDKYIQFTIEDLQHDHEKLKEFILVFSKKSTLETNILNQLYDDTGLFPEEINLENEFYKLYNQTRQMLIKELQKNNQLDKDKAIEYAQLILNRYMFICFCEDKDLLPENTSTDEILTPIRRKVLAINTIWNRLNELFYFINNGNPDNDITGYNGGLFKEDLSHLKIRDKIQDISFYDDIKVKWSFPEQEHIIDHELKHYHNINPIYRNLLIISSFDFNTDLTENILGHIFENSIADLEELKNEKESKRKKEGVYYTPEYITKYICENTIIPYLSNQDNNTIESLIKEYKNNIQELEEKLHNIKILDPACGSGAFLNKATDTLLNIHKAIFNLKHKDSDNLDKEFDNIDNRRDILLNNIYGVDLNHESIEITKLGLFLKVCKKGIKLPDLDKNIKCGNSLIDNPEYTDKPFKWEEEFPEIFKNGGFDIVIGNPPYVKADLQNEEYQRQRNFLKNSNDYETLYEKWDLFIAFIEKGLKIFKKEGYLSFIISNSYNTSKSAIKSKNFILDNYHLKQLDFFKNMSVFRGVGVESVILTVNNAKNNTPTKRILHDNEFNNKTILETPDDKDLIFRGENFINFNKNFENTELLGNICYISYGLRPNSDDKKYKGEFKKDDVISDTKNENFKKPYIEAKNIERYKINKIRFLEYDTDRVPLKIARPTFPELYNVEKLIRGRTIGCVYDENKLVCNDSCIVIVRFQSLKGINNKSIQGSIKKWNKNQRNELENISDLFALKYILAILNSKFAYFYLNSIRRHRIEYYFYPDDLKRLPIKKIKIRDQKLLIELATKIISLNKKLTNEINSFHKYLLSDFSVAKINNKLTKYYELNFEDLYKEVKKQNKQITRKEKDKLEKEYTLSIEIIVPLQKEIAKIDEKIDKLVYELYDLTPEEINIIEKSLQKH